MVGNFEVIRPAIDADAELLVPQKHNRSASQLAAPSHALPPMMTDISQKLPPELLAEVLSHVPVIDTLRFKQVKRWPLRYPSMNKLAQH